MKKNVKNNQISSFRKYKENIDITLYESHLKTEDKEAKYYGRIKRNVVDIKNIIAETEDENTGIDQSLMYHVATLIKKGMLDFLERGYSINVFDIGIIYITVKGEITKSMSKSEVAEHIHLSFTPLRESEEKISSLVVNNITNYQSPRNIDKVINLWDKENPENTVTPGKIAQIHGKNIKLGETNSWVYFAKADENGDMEDNPEKWIKCENIFSNKNDDISFFIPDNLERGQKYIIVIKTNLTVSGKASKTTNIIKSSLITVL